MSLYPSNEEQPAKQLQSELSH